MREMPETRQSLLLALRDQSDDAWAEFLEVYEKSIHNFCRKRGLQDADAQDVTQEVLIAVAKRIATFQSDTSKGTFRGWLIRIARNIAVDKFHELSRRAAAGRADVSEMLSAVPAVRDSQDTEFWMEYRRTLLAWAAEKVRPQFHESSWQAFWLSTVHGLSAKEVSQRLGMSVGSIYTAKCRVFAKIKSVVAALSHEETVAEMLPSYKEQFHHDEGTN